MARQTYLAQLFGARGMRRIGRYVVLGLLGRGGMGAVYKAAMPHTGRVVALKLLKPAEVLAATADPAQLRRDFYREAALMARIRHPNIAQVLDVDECADGPFFVMEYYCNNLGALLGESYRVEEPTRRLGVEQSLNLARQLTAALARLHFEGVLHRDVKPYNLMLAEQAGLGSITSGGASGGAQGDEVKLIDFGLSRLRGEVAETEATAPRPKGAVVGSPYYAAPEQERAPDDADERADLFSVGVTLFRCLTGLLPQEGLPASQLRQGLDGRFDDFFVRVCHEDRRQRPTSARALLAELDELCGHWARLREAVCALPEEKSGQEFEEDAGSPGHAVAAPRSQPMRQPLAGARERFGLDELWRPRVVDADRFEPACPASHGPTANALAGGEACVRDRRTGLLWQRGGTAYALPLAGAVAHAEALARERFAGCAGWRLPTAEELATLLLPEPDLRRLCLAPCFDPTQRRLWSADRKSFMAAWYADVEHGFVWWQDTTCEFHARCVCG